MPNVILGAYNTVPIAAASGVYRLKCDGTKTVDLMNVGAGAVSIRMDATDPTVNGAGTLQIPGNWALNRLAIDGNVGLGVIAAADTTLSVRVVG